jgi:hypothetical protein
MNDQWAEVDSTRGLGDRPGFRRRWRDTDAQAANRRITDPSVYHANIKEQGVGVEGRILAAAIRWPGAAFRGLRTAVRQVMITANQAKELLTRGRQALAEKDFQERSHKALVILPELLSALDYLAKRHLALAEIRVELTLGVRLLREQVWAAQKDGGGYTPMANNARIHRAMVNLNSTLDRFEKELDLATRSD